jgi:hypothetical protein
MYVPFCSTSAEPAPSNRNAKSMSKPVPGMAVTQPGDEHGVGFTDGELDVSAA